MNGCTSRFEFPQHKQLCFASIFSPLSAVFALACTFFSFLSLSIILLLLQILSWIHCDNPLLFLSLSLIPLFLCWVGHCRQDRLSAEGSRHLMHHWLGGRRVERREERRRVIFPPGRGVGLAWRRGVLRLSSVLQRWMCHFGLTSVTCTHTPSTQSTSTTTKPALTELLSLFILQCEMVYKYRCFLTPFNGLEAYANLGHA